MPGKRKADPAQPSPNFAPWVLRMGDQRGWSKNELARHCKMHPDTLRKIESGAPVRADIPMFQGIADALNLELGYVLHRAGFEINSDGVNMERLVRTEGIVGAFGEIEEQCRFALTEAAHRLEPDAPLDPADAAVVRDEITRALVSLDLAVSRLRADGHLQDTPGRVEGRSQPTVRGRSHWSPEEDRVLVSGASLSDDEIARRLGRPVNGVRHRRMQLAQEASS